MNLKDIAKKVGVSTATVSRIINNPNHKCHNKEIQDKVWDIVRNNQYVPNQSAKDLRNVCQSIDNANKKSIGLVFSIKAQAFNDHNFAIVARSVETECIKKNINIKFIFSFNKSVSIEDSIQFLSQNKVDGLVVFGKLDKNYHDSLKLCSKNILFVGFTDFDPDYDFVFFDGYKASNNILDYLYTNGHRSIAYIGSTEDEIRYDAYRNFMLKHNIGYDKNFIQNSTMSINEGFFACNRLLKHYPYPSAIFCSNDLIAVGVLKSISTHKLKVPKDISVVSVDDIEPAQFTYPMLTTVSIPKEEMGKLAINVLLSRIEKEHSVKIKIEVPNKLIIRDSALVLDYNNNKL